MANHMVVPGFDGAAHHQNIVVKDPRVNYVVTPHTKKVGGLGMGDQYLNQVDALCPEVVGR